MPSLKTKKLVNITKRRLVTRLSYSTAKVMINFDDFNLVIHIEKTASGDMVDGKGVDWSKIINKGKDW